MGEANASNDSNSHIYRNHNKDANDNQQKYENEAYGHRKLSPAKTPKSSGHSLVDQHHDYVDEYQRASQQYQNLRQKTTQSPLMENSTPKIPVLGNTDMESTEHNTPTFKPAPKPTAFFEPIPQGGPLRKEHRPKSYLMSKPPMTSEPLTLQSTSKNDYAPFIELLHNPLATTLTHQPFISLLNDTVKPTYTQQTIPKTKELRNEPTKNSNKYVPKKLTPNLPHFDIMGFDHNDVLMAKPDKIQDKPKPIKLFDPDVKTSIDVNEFYQHFNYNPDGENKFILALSSPAEGAIAGYQGTKTELEIGYYFQKDGESGVDNYIDAMRHALWNYRMAKSLGYEKAKIFGDAHEREASKDEQDSIAMDLYNNEVGRQAALDPKNKDKDDLDVVWQLYINDKLKTEPFMINTRQ